MSFCRYYGLGSELAVSKLAQIPEEQYRTPAIDRANVERLRNANRDRAACTRNVLLTPNQTPIARMTAIRVPLMLNCLGPASRATAAEKH
jgi:hypothetical protein